MTSSAIHANIGDGPLELIGEYHEPTDTTRAIQRIASREGPPRERVIGYFVFHQTHNHWHFEDFSLVEIVALFADAPAGEVVATSGKLTFCIRDRVRLSPPRIGSPVSPVYRQCKTEVQGISVGWTDLYEADVPGQQLNIEGLSDGYYLLRMTADPAGRIWEEDEGNNAVSVIIEIRGERVIRK